jgi:hypothetical protein
MKVKLFINSSLLCLVAILIYSRLTGYNLGFKEFSSSLLGGVIFLLYYGTLLILGSITQICIHSNKLVVNRKIAVWVSMAVIGYGLLLVSILMDKDILGYTLRYAISMKLKFLLHFICFVMFLLNRVPIKIYLINNRLAVIYFIFGFMSFVVGVVWYFIKNYFYSEYIGSDLFGTCSQLFIVMFSIVMPAFCFTIIALYGVIIKYFKTNEFNRHNRLIFYSSCILSLLFIFIGSIL